MPSSKRHLAREICLQALYQCDTLSDWSPSRGEQYFSSVLPEYLELEAPPQFDLSFASELFFGVLRERAKLDDILGGASTHWALERMTPIDRNILRVSAFELLFHPETSIGICISEALELAKAFSSDESPKFINGVLDKVAANRINV